MAVVRPFRAWRYAAPHTDISALTAPPYDVVSDEQRAALVAGDAHNVVALELPEGELDASARPNRYETGRATWDAWREQGVLQHDDSPAVYVLEQRFELGDRLVRRRAFIVEVGLEPFEAGVVIPHERTLPKALGDRFELIKATGANLSQVFGLYEDESGVTDALFETAVAGDPVATATDADGVTSVLWRCADDEVAAGLSRFMEDRRIFIADGHHRYTTALAYRDHRRAEAPGEPVTDAAYESVMMALVNMDDPDLVVLPYHRMASSSGDFDTQEFYTRLGELFDVHDLPEGHPSDALEGHERVAFLVKTRTDARPRLAVLKEDVELDEVIKLDHSREWKDLDVAVVQELVLWPLLGVHPNRPETLERLSFTKDAHTAFRAAGTHDVALVLRPTPLSALRAVSLGGETMPQKSTYFYPKLLSGLVMRSAE